MTSVFKKICFYLTTRGNYAKTKTIIDVLKDEKSVEIQYIVGGDCPKMEFYGIVKHLSIGDGSANSISLISKGVIPILEELKPNILVVIADRFETLPVTMVAYYMGIPIAHIEGGEQSGAIDNKIRHANTQFATLHFPCTEDAKNRIIQMGINEKNVFMTGSTSFDMLRLYGNDPIDIKSPYLLVTFHPGSMSNNEIMCQFKEILWAISSLGMKTYWIRPNIDVGNKVINKELDKIKWPFIHVTNSMKIEKYAPLMANASCIIGNSSSGIREASFLGVPVVNIGNRQMTRQTLENVINVPGKSEYIIEVVNKQIKHNRYKPDCTYGNGYAGEKIAKVLINYVT